MRQKYYILTILLIGLILVSGCVSPDEPTNPKEHVNDPQINEQKEPQTEEPINSVVSDLEAKLTEKPWRPSTSFGTTGSRSRLVLKKGFLGNTWEFGSKTSSSNGNWELKDLTEKDIGDLSSLGYSVSDASNKKRY